MNLPIATNLCLYLLYHFLLICSHMLLFCYPWSYILDASNFVNIFSIATHVFHNLFWKICPILGQILITCLKFSRAFFFCFLLIGKRCAENKVAGCHQLTKNILPSKSYPPHSHLGDSSQCKAICKALCCMLYVNSLFPLLPNSESFTWGMCSFSLRSKLLLVLSF